MMPAGAPAGSGQRVIWLAQLSPLPHAAGRPEISPARRRLSLALVHDILWRGAPPVLRFEPGHPALRAKHIQAVEWHLLPPSTVGAPKAESEVAPGWSHLTGLTCPGRRRRRS